MSEEQSQRVKDFLKEVEAQKKDAAPSKEQIEEANKNAESKRNRKKAAKLAKAKAAEKEVEDFRNELKE